LANKKSVLFVGAFLEKAQDGAVGGQMFACRSLVQSELNNLVEFIQLDTTTESVPPPPLSKRAKNAFFRLLRFIKISLVRRPDRALIFCADGFSILEKGAMAFFFSFVLRRPVILAPRSGFILNDVKKSRFMRWFISALVNRVDVVICQSESWKIFFYALSNKQDSEKFVIIPNWLDTQVYIQNRLVYSTDPANQKLKILFLGWIEEAKGIFDLLSAIQMLKPMLTDQEFLIAGDGGARAEAGKRAVEMQIDSYIKFVGWADVEKKLSLLRQADLYVFPSHFEGYPNSLLEAMASQLPVITTRVGAVPEVVQDQANGLLIDIRDTKALAAALQKLLQDPTARESLGKKAREFVVRNNSIENAVDRFKEVLM